ncbi:MAG TPA: hypothetical protein VGG06_22290 [Thermoanaerobaculia bacterium]
MAALDREEIGASNWFAIQADAWAVFGSALRSVCHLGDSEGALNVAIAFLTSPELRGNGDPLAYAHLAQRAAYLRRDQERFEEALELIDEAVSVYREHGTVQALAGALADRGSILGRAGHNEEALAHLSEALDHLDADLSPRNYFSAVYNVALYLHDLADDSPEVNELAVRWLELARRCHTDLPTESLSLLKLKRLEGLTSIRLGQIEAGLRELWQTHAGLGRLGADFEQALTLLHLAATYLAQGRPQEVKGVAARLFPVFRGLKTDREARAALMLFYNAAQAETATLELIDRVSAIVQEAQARSLMRARS